jgi:hypothetical protein
LAAAGLRQPGHKLNFAAGNPMKEPLSETSVTLQLSLIQKRCNELMDGQDELELSLEDPPQVEDGSRDPYNSRS